MDVLRFHSFFIPHLVDQGMPSCLLCSYRSRSETFGATPPPTPTVLPSSFSEPLANGCTCLPEYKLADFPAKERVLLNAN